MKNFLILFCVLVLVSCGRNGKDGSSGVGVTAALVNTEGPISLDFADIDPGLACASGGVSIFTFRDNDFNGLNGEHGLPGVQGIPGLAGSSGTIVTPVKFCVTDSSTFPEYGLMIGEELFAVYWGSTPASPSTPQAFLTKLVAGNYMSTGGNNCLFTIH